MTVAESAAQPNMHESTDELVRLLDGSDVLTDANEKHHTVERVRALTKAITTTLNEGTQLFSLSKNDLEQLATGNVPT